jgi:lipid A ethanolaminephosphotransferase
VHVILLGETARAASFSLTGYPRQTNPELAAETVYRAASISTCGTATAQSVPCMFSLQTMAEFDGDTTRYQDNLLDIAARAGYEVYWVENGNSCKNVCARVGSRDLTETPDPEFCVDGRCYDEALVIELQHILESATRDTLVVLHQIGSHGPAYYRRYPEAFRRFEPDCRSPDLGDCTPEEIVNAYDNTILYTDHVIAAAIESLEAVSDRLQTSLVYVSDHGESLGEHHLYLHGVPRMLAPAEQTEVPLIAWFSRPAMVAEGLNAHCDSRLPAMSHDNLVHTELGILQIETDVYSPDLDIFSACRRSPHGVGASF